MKTISSCSFLLKVYFISVFTRTHAENVTEQVIFNPYIHLTIIIYFGCYFYKTTHTLNKSMWITKAAALQW